MVFCGDLNVAHQEIDLARPKENRRNAGFSDEEREGFGPAARNRLPRHLPPLHPDQAGAYSWWSFRANARANNVGWRIDYFGAVRRPARPGRRTPRSCRMSRLRPLPGVADPRLKAKSDHVMA